MFSVLQGHAQNGEKFELAYMHVPTEGEQSNVLSFHFSSDTVKKYAFNGLLDFS